jgi:hypothetical protein
MIPDRYARIVGQKTISARIVEDVRIVEGRRSPISAQLEVLYRPDGTSADMSDCIAHGEATGRTVGQDIFVGFLKVVCSDWQTQPGEKPVLLAFNERAQVGIPPSEAYEPTKNVDADVLPKVAKLGKGTLFYIVVVRPDGFRR